MVAAEAKYGPHAEKANDRLNDGGRRGLDRLDERLGLRANHQIRNVTCQNVETKRRQRDEEHVEESVVAFAHTVGHPRAMVIETF